jgi:hypothetical protein
MEIVTVLRIYWRRRKALGVGALVALLSALALGHSSVAPSGVAEVRVVFDTPQSQLVADDPRGADSLPWRATLAAMVLGTGPSRQVMAVDAEIPVDEIAVTDVELTVPSVPASLPRAAVEAAITTTQPYVVTVHTDDDLPVVSIATSAPTRTGAARLAQAAIHALQSGVSPVTTEELQGLSVQEVGPVEARQLPGGRGRKKAAVMAMGIFVLWCMALFLRPGLAGVTRTLRETRAVAS